MAKNRLKTDTVLKDFWRDNARFADIVNAVVFGGREVVKPESLSERDADLSGIIEVSGQKESLERARDVVKKAALGMEFAIIGIENQQKVHYAMPLRTLLYDGLGYMKECQEITRYNRENGLAAGSAEFLSGLRKGDRLHPVITIVICYSEEVWDGPLSLGDMVTDMPDEIRPFFSDYRLNLIQLVESDGYVFHNDDIRTVFEISREILRAHFGAIREKYGDRNIRRELATVIGKITGIEELSGQGSEEEINMCTAIEKLKEKERMEGRVEGRMEGRMEGRVEGRMEGSREMMEQMVRGLLGKAVLSDEDIISVANISAEELQSIRATVGS